MTDLWRFIGKLFGRVGEKFLTSTLPLLFRNFLLRIIERKPLGKNLPYIQSIQ